MIERDNRTKISNLHRRPSQGCNYTPCKRGRLKIVPAALVLYISSMDMESSARPVHSRSTSIHESPNSTAHQSSCLLQAYDPLHTTKPMRSKHDDKHEGKKPDPFSHEEP
mmetsp:Transcript_21994/g.32488  ORF Transcript_21994/g.32488 Transcript_21994/m.32488 type:complete len:110 (+) Transcript_21994:183-512(+)